MNKIQHVDVKHLANKQEIKRQQALAYLGEKYLCHPANQVKHVRERNTQTTKEL